MKDNELYDFFADRKQAFDEAPDGALWAKIEGTLNGTATPAPTANKLTLFKKLLIVAVVGAAVAITFFVAYRPNDIEETTLPVNAKVGAGEGAPESRSTIIEDADVQVYTGADSVKKKKLPVPQADAILNPIPKAPRPAAVAIAAVADTTRFDIDAVKTETKTAPGRMNIMVKQPLTKARFDLFTAKTIRENSNAAGTIITIKAPGHKPFRQLVPVQAKAKGKVADTPGVNILEKQLTARDSVKTQPVVIAPYAARLKTDSIKIKQPVTQLEKALKQEKITFVNEVIVTGNDTVIYEPKEVKADVKTAPGRITITVKQQLTKEEFKAYTEKVANDSTHEEGTIIIIRAKGHKQFRYEVPETDEFDE